MAAFDTSMYSQIKPVEMQNPLTQFAQVQAIQQAQNQNRLADLAFGEKQRERDETSRQNALYADAVAPDGTIDRKKLVTGFAQGGLGSKLPGIQKQFAESDKATADLDKVRFDVASKRYETFQTVTGALAQEPNLTKDMVVQAGRQLVEMGVLPEAMYQQSLASMPDDPIALRQKLAGSIKAQLTPEQMFTVFAPKPTEVSNGQQKFFTDTNPNSPTFGQMVGGAPTKMQMTPGEVAADRRSSAQLAQSDRHHRESLANNGGKAPAGYRWSADGTKLEAIQGGPADKAAVATEGERKAATLLQRLEFSEKQLSKAIEEKPGAAKPGVVASGLRAVGAESLANTVAVGPERQRVEGAQLDLLDAALTLGTGAAYTREQLEGYRKSYFPQIGDTDDAIKDKQARLSNVIQAAKIAAGRAATGKPVDAPARNAAPKAGDVMDGYRFKGGNPADKSNWVKVS